MKRFLALLSLACVALLGQMLPLAAQVSPGSTIENVPLPPGPALNRAPDSSRWTVTYTLTDPDKGPSGNASKVVRLQSMRITKTKDVYHQEKFFTDGSKSDSWHMGTAQIMVTVEGKVVMYDRSSFGRTAAGIIYDPDLYTDYSLGDFPDLSWITPQSYIGIQKIGDTALLVFREGGGSAPADAGAGSAPTAFLDPKTRLPVRVKSGLLTILYQFSDLAEQTQTLPPDIQDFLNKRAALIRKTTTRVPSY